MKPRPRTQAGDIAEDRVIQLGALLELAAEDLKRVTREQ